MARKHKFLVLVEPSDYILDEMEGNVDKNVIDQVHCCDDYHLSVITCNHEKVEDNLVTVSWTTRGTWVSGKFDPDAKEEHEATFLRDSDGTLWSTDRILSKMDLVRLMEEEN